MNSVKMNDKVIEDFDADFISDMLIASDDLQIADSFIEDFMGELNKSSTQNLSNTGNNLEWADTNHTDNYQLGNQQDTVQYGNYPYQLQLVQNDQGFVSAQQLHDLQSNTLNGCTNTFNFVQPQNLNSFSSFNPAIPNNILNTDENIAMMNSTVQQQYTDNSVKSEPKNLSNTLKSDNLKQAPVFNFSDLTSSVGNQQTNKKQKSRSINSIINENNSNIQQQNNFTPTLLNQNINQKVYQINPSNIQVLIEKPAPLATATTTKVAESRIKQNESYKSETTSPFKENHANPQGNEPFKLLNTDDITPIKKPGKFKKKTSHNAIEKKYRSSINDKINELKHRVAGPGAKLQKSGILRKALEYITNIENVNTRLCDENKMLRSTLKKISLNTSDINAINDTLRSINYLPSLKLDSNSSINPNTPPNSSSSCDSDSLFSNFDSASPSSTNSSLLSSPISPSTSSFTSSPEPKAKKPKRTYTRKATTKKDHMIDSSRIMLCMFAMSVLFFNPFSLILSQADPSLTYQTADYYSGGTSVNSRVLNTIDLDQPEHSNASNPNINTKPTFDGLYMLSMLLNVILVTFCLLRVYVSGDPTIDYEKASNSKLWSTYQKASHSFQRKDYEEASNRLKESLKDLGQNAPSTKAELIIGIMWQLIKLSMDKLYIGRVLSKLSTYIYGTENFTAYRLSALHHFELHKFAYLNLKSERDLKMNVNQQQASEYAASMYSYLTGIYYSMVAYSMNTVYVNQSGIKLSARQEYNNYEMYFSLILYCKFFLPLRVSSFLTKYVYKQWLMQDLDTLNSSKMCKLHKIKTLLRKRIFVEFLEEFDSKSNLDLDDEKNADQQKSLNLIVYKRRLLSGDSFLDESDKDSQLCDISTSSVSCDYILQKFQEFVFYKMTDQIINQTSLISTEKIIKQNSDNFDCQLLDGEETELVDGLADDQYRFNQLVELYEQNLEYFGSNNKKLSKSVIQETQFTLVKFLNMTNSWKLRKFDFEIGDDELKNSYKSEFIGAVLNVLKAYKCILEEPRKSLALCKQAVEALERFNETKSLYGRRSDLMQKFELLINDWILSAQTHIWTNHKINDITLFNEALKNFEALTVYFPELCYKSKMYETVFMYASNRNPINLLDPTAKQTVFSICNQEAFFSMNTILKSFRLQITE